jgi:predicted dehydrogenase
MLTAFFQMRQAVDICTPTSHHAEQIRSAIEAGKDFICEKPLCEELSVARELAELVEKHHRIGMLGYIYRFAPIFELAQSLFQEVPKTGESLVMGKIVSAHFRLGGRGSHQVWKHRKESSGGAINEMLVHMIDLAIWYFGAVKHVDVLACDLLRERRVIQGIEYEVDAEDYVLARMEMESGISVFCQADLVTPAFTQFIEVQGENGTFMGSIQPDMPSFLYCNKERAGYRAGKTPFDLGPHNLFEAQMADFVHAVRTRKPPSRSTIKDSVLLMEAMNEVLR